MSTPLTTKGKSPLSENVQIGPKESIFCVATIIFQHCLNPLGHGVHQSFTGCHWIPLSLLHDDITELVDVRDLALHHLPFEDAPQITFTLSFFSKAVVVLEVCLGLLSCWHTALRPSLRREGIMLCFSMPHNMLAFMVLIRPQDMFPVIHVLSQLVFSKLSCASSLEKASFWDDSHADQFDAVCSLCSEHWQADPPPLQPLQQCWQHSYIYFPNTTSGYNAEHVHSTSLVDHGKACSEWNLSC